MSPKPWVRLGIPYNYLRFLPAYTGCKVAPPAKLSFRVSEFQSFERSHLTIWSTLTTTCSPLLKLAKRFPALDLKYQEREKTWFTKRKPLSTRSQKHTKAVIPIFKPARKTFRVSFEIFLQDLVQRAPERIRPTLTTNCRPAPRAPENILSLHVARWQKSPWCLKRTALGRQAVVAVLKPTIEGSEGVPKKRGVMNLERPRSLRATCGS